MEKNRETGTDMEKNTDRDTDMEKNTETGMPGREREQSDSK